MDNSYEKIYNVGLLDDLHNFFPEVLYNPRRFRSVQELLLYVQSQTLSNFNLYNRGMRSYTGGAVRQSPPVNVVTETIDITPIFSRSRSNGNVNVFEDLLNIFRRRDATDMTDVIVAPTGQQISNATSLRAATSNDETEVCSICQDNFTEGQALRKLNHCHHEFHKNCIDTWFQRNVHCPVCRFDIRDTSTSNSA
jgi:hypothetical protein